MDKFEGKELGPWRCRPFYANQSSELNFPTFLGKNGPNSEERGTHTNPILTDMAQVLPFLNTSGFWGAKSAWVKMGHNPP